MSPISFQKLSENILLSLGQVIEFGVAQRKGKALKKESDRRTGMQSKII